MTLEWADDFQGRRSQHLYTLDNPVADLGDSGAIQAALAACSAGVVVFARMSPALVIGGTPGSSAFATCDDYAKIQMRSAAGEPVDISIIAPLSTIFTGSGSDRLDLGNSLVQDLVGALTSFGASSSGSPLVSVINTGRFKRK